MKMRRAMGLWRELGSLELIWRRLVSGDQAGSGVGEIEGCGSVFLVQRPNAVPSRRRLRYRVRR